MSSAASTDEIGPRFSVRRWCSSDDVAMRAIIRSQMEVDAGWPPDYARRGDLMEWLARPADRGRWVAVDQHGKVVGHVGTGAVRAGPVAALLCAALPCERDQMAEICRMVVAPESRGHGLSGLLTRAAMRACIEAEVVPVSTVLRSRGSWLTMMLATGWRRVGATEGGANDDLVVLIPPQRFIDAALRGRRT